jgi:hypothetical protein
MTDILDTVAKTRGKFIPSKPLEYTALQLARKLSDEEAVRYYLTLFDRHEPQVLLRAFRQCRQKGNLSGPEFVRLLRELIPSAS